MQDKAISNEVLARIFAAYLGSEVIAEYNADFPMCKGVLTGIHGEFGAEIQFLPNGNAEEEPQYRAYDNCQLILKSIEDVASDEETCFYIAEMFGATLQSKHATRDNILQFGATRAVLESNNLPVADYLRSKSYALPINGIDLFEAGIATKKEGGND